MAQAVIHHQEFPAPSFSWPLWRALRSLIRSGHLRVVDHKGEVHDFGDRTDKPVSICFRNARIERALLFDPQLALAEGYMEGSIHIEAGTVYDLLSLLARNLANNDLPSWMQLADKFRLLTRLARQRNDPLQAKRNASRHYDLPRSLYELFLDRDKQYSCAYFTRGKRNA
jgi:cyclopropane-fatty-acyl-phospholipid synthase